MIRVIVFSHNRAAQLDLLLRSIERHAPGVFDLVVTYNYSSDEFRRGYEILQEERPGDWVCQRGYFGTERFKGFVLALLGTGDGYACFFCDDDVFYRPVALNLVKQIGAGVACFSLRLGRNTTVSYMLGRDNPMDLRRDHGEKFIRWDWKIHKAENGYPLSVNGHVFKAQELRHLLRLVNFETVNTLEARLQRLRWRLPRYMAAYAESRLVNVPANRIQDEYPNRYGERFPRSAEELNEAFLRGERIDLDGMDFSAVQSCCQELALPMRRPT